MRARGEQRRAADGWRESAATRYEKLIYIATIYIYIYIYIYISATVPLRHDSGVPQGYSGPSDLRIE